MVYLISGNRILGEDVESYVLPLERETEKRWYVIRVDNSLGCDRDLRR